jgi:hypothetical protein
MGGIYEVRRSDGLKCYDMHIKFHKDWFNHSYVIIEDTQTGRSHKPTLGK